MSCLCRVCVLAMRGSLSVLRLLWVPRPFLLEFEQGWGNVALVALLGRIQS